MTEFVNLIQKQTELLTGLLELEKNKTDVLVVADITKLDDIVKKEQYFIMKSASYENQRNKYMENLGFADHTASEFLEAYEQHEMYNQMLELFENLSAVLKEIEHVNMINQRLIKSRIDILQCIIGSSDTQHGSVYSQSAIKTRL